MARATRPSGRTLAAAALFTAAAALAGGFGCGKKQPGVIPIAEVPPLKEQSLPLDEIRKKRDEFEAGIRKRIAESDEASKKGLTLMPPFMTKPNITLGDVKPLKTTDPYTEILRVFKEKTKDKDNPNGTEWPAFVKKAADGREKQKALQKIDVPSPDKVLDLLSKNESGRDSNQVTLLRAGAVSVTALNASGLKYEDARIALMSKFTTLFVTIEGVDKELTKYKGGKPLPEAEAAKVVASFYSDDGAMGQIIKQINALGGADCSAARDAVVAQGNDREKRYYEAGMALGQVKANVPGKALHDAIDEYLLGVKRAAEEQAKDTRNFLDKVGDFLGDAGKFVLKLAWDILTFPIKLIVCIFGGCGGGDGPGGNNSSPGPKSDTPPGNTDGKGDGKQGTTPVGQGADDKKPTIVAPPDSKDVQFTPPPQGPHLLRVYNVTGDNPTVLVFHTWLHGKQEKEFRLQMPRGEAEFGAIVNASQLVIEGIAPNPTNDGSLPIRIDFKVGGNEVRVLWKDPEHPEVLKGGSFPTPPPKNEFDVKGKNDGVHQYRVYPTEDGAHIVYEVSFYGRGDNVKRLHLPKAADAFKPITTDPKKVRLGAIGGDEKSNKVEFPITAEFKVEGETQIRVVVWTDEKTPTHK